MKLCQACGLRPPKTAWAHFCYDCRPYHGPTPPPCRRCGSCEDYYSSGLCARCHRLSPRRVDSCIDCYAWGAIRANKWLCEACRGWRRAHRVIACCRRCQRAAPVDDKQICRLCRKQPAPASGDGHPCPPGARAQQLFFAGMSRARWTGPHRRPELPKFTARPAGKRLRAVQLAAFPDLVAPKEPMRPRTCPICEQRPVKFPWANHCHQCAPGGAETPPPCRRCGSSGDYYSSGLCARCHKYAPVPVESCVDCFAWGATRTNSWRCEGCRSWQANHPGVAPCVSCGRLLHVAEHGACRLCYREAARYRGRNGALDVTLAVAGQQLFLAETVRASLPPKLRPAPPPPAVDVAGRYPVGHRQLALFRAAHDLHLGLRAGFGDPPDPDLATALKDRATGHADGHGWSVSVLGRVRQGINILLALQDTIGAKVDATEVIALSSLHLPAEHIIVVLDTAGMLTDDRPSTLDAWFARQVTGLPAGMVTELNYWFDIAVNGSPVAPRSRPRKRDNIQKLLRAARPAFEEWAEQGHTSLREITRQDVLAVLPPSGNDRVQCGTGLRAIFKVLKTHRVIFLNPTSRVRLGKSASRIPMPADLDTVRQLLDNPDPAIAVLAALVAFHAFSPSQLRQLQISDVADGRLVIGGRTVLLADAVRHRLARYLDHRNSRWPATANTHLFINQRSALRTSPVHADWISARLTGLAKLIREDRILDELHATGGDLRRLSDLFGLSIQGADRYAAALNHPDLDAQDI